MAESFLALEDAETSVIVLNGEAVSSTIDGWYVDKAISTVSLPALNAGENILEITVPIGRRTNLEYFYLLGDFGVRVNGTEKSLTAPVKELGFGDITRQGLPFYTGNLLYHLAHLAVAYQCNLHYIFFLLYNDAKIRFIFR